MLDRAREGQNRTAMQVSRSGSNLGSDVKERSGWTLPAVIAAAIALLSVFFLLFYFGPNPASFIEEHQSPSSRTDLIRLEIGRLALSIPENYLQYASARGGGVRREVALFARLPDLSGYAEPYARIFNEGGAHSPIVHMLIREDAFGVPEWARLTRIYLGEVDDPHGRPGPYGLVEYTFRDDSGYRGEDLFVGRLDDQTVVMRCTRASTDVPDPDCRRDVPLGRGAALGYRFARSRLSDWREIARGVKRLVAGFAAQHA